MVAINETWRLAPWADALYACDDTWWRRRGPAAGDFAGLRIAGADPAPGCVFAGIRAWLPPNGRLNNSAAQALVLAAAFGARRAILTGCDCRGSHWHGVHGDGLANPTATHFEKWPRGFAEIAPILAAWGCDVVNASRETEVTAFPRLPIEAALDG